MVSQSRRFDVTLQFGAFLGQLIGDFRTAAGFVQLFQGTRNQDVFTADLGVVGQTVSSDSGGERGDVVAFNNGVVGNGGGQFVNLPFINGVGGGTTANVAGERGVFRRDVVNDIGEVFADALRVITRVGVGNSSHVNSLKSEVREVFQSDGRRLGRDPFWRGVAYHDSLLK